MARRDFAKSHGRKISLNVALCISFLATELEAHDNAPVRFNNCAAWAKALAPDPARKNVARYLPNRVFRNHLTETGDLPFRSKDLKTLLHFMELNPELDFKHIFSVFLSYVDHSEDFVDIFRVALGLRLAGYQVLDIFYTAPEIASEIDLIVVSPEGRTVALEIKSRLSQKLGGSTHQFSRLQSARGLDVHRKSAPPISQTGLIVTRPGSAPELAAKVARKWIFPDDRGSQRLEGL